jgi:drug/metabolite transporter (DMT)-like permease
MIGIKLSSLKDTKLHEHAVRFLFGGFCTAMAGVIAKKFGPGIGGLFLAFPAIFPSGLTLIANHEKKRKAEIGFDGTDRGRFAASIDSKGAALGCVGLVGFAFVVWIGLRNGKSSLMVVLGATSVWLVLSVGLWLLEKHRLFRKP